MKYLNKQIEIEAIQFKGDNIEEIKELAGAYFSEAEKGIYVIETMKGGEILKVTDYLVKENDGVFYPLDKDMFKNHFEVSETKKKVSIDMSNDIEIETSWGSNPFKPVFQNVDNKGIIECIDLMQLNSGVIVRSCAITKDNQSESMCFVPGAKIVEEKNKDGEIINRRVR